MEPRTDLTMLSPGWADDAAPKAAHPAWESDEESRPPPDSLPRPGLLSNLRINIMDGGTIDQLYIRFLFGSFRHETEDAHAAPPN